MLSMRKLKSAGATVALALCVAVGSLPAADAPTPAAVLKALAEAGRPGAEHEKLQPFIGNWTFTMKMWTDPSQPPAVLKGEIDREWVMGGRFVQESVRGACSEGESFEGLGLIGYDRSQQKYTTMHACGMCGLIMNGASSVNADGTKFVCSRDEKCPLTGETVQSREEMVIESPDRIVLTTYREVGGKEFKAMELVSVRRN